MELWKSFRALYFATLLMLLGSGLLSTYLALQIADKASSIWVGALMTGFYLGLVLGGKLGHRLIARVGHIRAYVASAGVVTAAVLGHGLTQELSIWLGLRVIVGLGMMCMYMVIESWLNEQSSAHERGLVFSGYMMASYLGMVLGQLVLVALPNLGTQLLLLVALCFSLCLVPVAVTRRIHPEPLRPAPLNPRYFISKIPLSMITGITAGLAVGAFYGLAPLYAKLIGLPTDKIGLFMAICIVAGLLVQWPIGWLSDRLARPTLIRGCSIILMFTALPLAIFSEFPLWAIFTLGAASSALFFSLYPLAVALANDHVDADRRVSLTAVMLTIFGVGASIGPLLAGSLMNLIGANMLYAFFTVCAVIIAICVHPSNIPDDTVVEDTLQHVVMPDSLSSSPLVAALDPRVDEAVVQEQMQEVNLDDIALDSEEQHY